MKNKKPYPSKGDTVRVKKGPYKGLKATLRNRGCMVKIEEMSHKVKMWYAEANNTVIVVFEDEL